MPTHALTEDQLDIANQFVDHFWEATRDAKGKVLKKAGRALITLSPEINKKGKRALQKVDYLSCISYVSD